MEKTQSAVTDKIRCAIKEKLMEINAFVDDELPDYIMILVANKRSKHHMEKDLSLFLGSETAVFTNWLWDLVNTLKVGAKARSSKSSSVLNSNDSEDHDLKEIRNDEDDVLNYDPAEEGESLCLEDVNESLVNQLLVPQNIQVVDSKITELKESKLPHATAVNELSVGLTPQATTQVEKDWEVSTAIIAEGPQIYTHSDVTSALSSGSLSSSTKKLQKSAKVYPMQRVRQNPTSAHNLPSKQKTEYDLTIPAYPGSISSVVCVTQRKYGGPAALQANKLLLKAINDAAKSVLKGKDVNDYYKPTPLKVLSPPKMDDHVKDDKSSDSLIDPGLKVKNEQQLRAANFFDLKEIKSDNIEPEIKPEPRRVLHTISLPPVCPEDEWEDIDESIDDQSPPVSEREANVTPHFIVTLDGVNFPSLKRKYSRDEPMDIDEEVTCDELADDSPVKKQKFERCKYWPACKNSNDCAYHHPTVPCKRFPDCKYGDKCLYIHPNCKFDSLCSRKDCPYTHCSKRKFNAAPLPVAKPVKIKNAKIVCKYYPKCTAKPCRYIHPKLCRFGTQCRAPKCLFSHFAIPNKNQLRWKANS